jgi:hypothetical protein
MYFVIWLALLLQLLVPCLAAPHEVFFEVDSTDDPTLTRSANWGARPERSLAMNATMTFEFVGTGLNIVLRTFKTYGLVQIELDGQVTTVDTYSDSGYVYTTCALCLTTLDEGRHAVRLINMGPTGGMTGSGSAWMTIASLSYITDDLLPESTSPTTTHTPALTKSGGVSLPHNQSSSTPTDTSIKNPSASPSYEKASNPGSVSVAVIVGSVIAGVVILAMLGSVLFWLAYRRYRSRRQPAFVSTPQPVSPYQHLAGGTPPLEGMVSEKRRRAALLVDPKAAPRDPSAQEESSVRSNRSSSDGLRDEVRQLREIVVQLATPPQYASERGHE